MTIITIPTHGGKDPDAQNRVRVRRGVEMVNSYGQMAGASFEDSLSDILADLMHFAHANDESFEKELLRACQAFATETGNSYSTVPGPVIDPDERGHALLDNAIAVQRHIAAHGIEAFSASHDDDTGHEDEIVYRSAPRWAWDIMDETLDADTRSKAFDPDLRESIRSAITSMILSCERADDEPISKEEAATDSDEEAQA